jgi:hypothetical protein
MASWWSLPRAVESESKTFYGGVNSQGDVVVIEMDGTTVTRHEIDSAVVDDHCTAALLVPADKPPIVEWNRHAATSNLYIQRGSGNPLDFTTMNSTQVLTFGTNASYGQIYRETGTDNLFLFGRYGTSNDEWGVLTSTDYGANWSSVQSVFDFDGNHGFMASVQVGDILRVVCIGHPTLSTTSYRDPRYFEIDLTTGDVDDNDGNNIGNLDGTSLPIDVASETEIYDFGTDGTRVFDISTGTEPAIAMATWTNDTDTEYRFLLRQSAATPTWTDKYVQDAGDVFSQGSNPANTTHYNGGMSFINPDDDYTLYLSREDSGTWYIDKYETSDDGDNWTVTNVASSSISESHAYKLVRPYCPVNAGGGATVAGPEVLWHGVIDYTGFTNYQAHLVADQTGWTDG